MWKYPNFPISVPDIIWNNGGVIVKSQSLLLHYGNSEEGKCNISLPFVWLVRRYNMLESDKRI